MRNGCSDRLSREGRDLSFDEAMDLYEGQIEEELGEFLYDSGDPIVDATWKQTDKELGADIKLAHYAEAMRQAALIARGIYAQAAGDEEWAARTMQEHSNEYVQKIGEALETSDYSILVI